MSKHDWYRRRTWTEADQAAFFERLKRSRSAHCKVQYLRVQAWYLYQAGMIEASLALVELLLTEHPISVESGPAHTLRAQSLIALGRNAEAIEACRAAMTSERIPGTFGDDVCLLFGELVIQAKRVDLYNEVMASLDEFSTWVTLFPVQRCRYACIRTFLAKHLGKNEEAAEWAKRAIDEASCEQSAFRYHPNLGLVESLPPDLRKQLEEVARPLANDRYIWISQLPLQPNN